MNLWAPKLHLVSWTLVSLHLVSSELMVKHTQLQPCEKNKYVCVTNSKDCDLRPPSSVQVTLNVTCYYQEMTNRIRSVTCDWNQEPDLQSDASLIFTSRHQVWSCQGIFNPAAVLSVTVRRRSYRTGRESWSQPHTVLLSAAIRPPQPGLAVLGSTADSLVVLWSSSVDGSCRLRYRLNNTHMWTQVLDSISARANQNLNYEIRNLLPFKAYRAAVGCRGTNNIWSDWSSDAYGRTLDRICSRPSEVCYRVERTDSSRSLLHLMWEAPDPGETEGRVLGYQVSISPQGESQNSTEVRALLVVEEGNYSVSVQAFNTAGYGPAAHLQIDTREQTSLPSVRDLWISSFYPRTRALLVQWTFPSSAPFVRHVGVEWRSEERPSSSRWTRVDAVAASAVIPDVDPEESYLVSVFPVSNQQCGPAQSLAASLQLGALMEAVNLKVIHVTKTTVTITWAWQRKSGPIRVNGYRAMLKRDSDTQTLSLWPDQWQHTFFNLTPNTEYSLFLLADDALRSIITVTTYYDEVLVAATATPLLLLAAAVMIISILSRTVFKPYFFPPISSPRLSTTGRWLMSPNLEKCSDRNILNIRDFEVTDFLGVRSLILVGPNDQVSSEDLHEDSSLLSTSSLDQTPTFSLEKVSVCETEPITEQQLTSHQSCRHDDGVLTSEESVCEAGGRSPPKGDIYQTSHQTEAAVFPFREFLSSSHFLSDLLRTADAETATEQTDCSYPVPQMEYLTNGCSKAGPPESK